MRPDGEKQSFPRALHQAMSGFIDAFLHERNVQIDCVFAGVAVILGFVFSLSVTHWLILVLCIGVVLGFELLNTALESLLDLVYPTFHPLAGRVKDYAAGACFIASLSALVIGFILFAPPLVRVVLGVIS